jgi:tetratricopeptide (TPR) repeat protein
MRCPHCHAEPPRDPFVCATCGERLLTYLGEPFGPGTGLRPEELVSDDGARREPVGAHVAARAAAPVAADGRSWLARQIDPTPPPGQGQPASRRPVAPRPDKPADIGFSLLGRIVFGVLAGLFVAFEWPLGGLLLLAALAVVLLRWPRMRFIPFAGVTIALAATMWVMFEIVDEIDPSDLGIFDDPTPTIEQPFATSTPDRPAGTPTLLPAQRTATATAVAGESRLQVAHARARWLRGDNQTALANLDRALTLTPGDANALNLRALVRAALGDYAGAAADSRRAVDAQPSSGSYRDTHAYALLKQGQYAEARDEYERALGALRGSDRAGALIGIGLAYHGLGQLAETSTNIRAGLAALPDTDPDPQLADLEASAHQALAGLPGSPTVPSSSASPSTLVVPAVSPVASPSASPVASPSALRDAAAVVGRAP